MSDDKSLPKETRKELQVQHAPKLRAGAKLIKRADKICNIKDVIYSPPPNWSIERRLEYPAWAERVVKAMNGCSDRLEEEFYRFLGEGREKIGAI